MDGNRFIPCALKSISVATVTVSALLFFLFWLGSALSQSHKHCLAASDVDHYFAKNSLTDTQYTCFQSYFQKQCPIYETTILIKSIWMFFLSQMRFEPPGLGSTAFVPQWHYCYAPQKVPHCGGFSTRKGNNKIMRSILRALISCLTPRDDLCFWLPLL